ncbi:MULTISPECIES: nicotinate-nucleotide adenylyltransferase [Clostridium]|uniref:Probable nicotinate-nucleotide adenylyltransferase n=1 Tax=Clostridium nitritogenes TaxID=83340 RepID=A0ABP3X204_9CLOT|nr:nicotinate-nucleotide adenylyltransferase [Clostridium baratii]AQM61333.1 nicotinate-nicotinamide nucleotide adenylyltransferase [Clostridium baratii]KJU73226.1 nicotinate-nucleotide adenylyltransferase [Clostridium baratii]MBS6042072.1 nicotinate-nucleotide adenylyltransferase [Clostridium baratii]MBT9831063.1 nicotinate-nucleotide adenylyltransferase [Clostridium baratii]MDY3206231.1 nicotinate-nucleotide adenylyltransferase [Clostridium baratii]
MKKYGIIGGTFDPIHNAHLYIAYEAKELLGLDKVIFIPNGSPPHKDNKNITGASLRYRMVLEAIKDFEDFEVSKYEIEKKELSYTYKTLEHFKEDDVELYFITGADCLVDLDKWKNVSEIFSLCKFVVFTRPGFKEEDLIEEKKRAEKKYNGEIIFLNILDLEISSTDIRKRISEGKRIDFFVPKRVINLIEKENIYNERN